MRIAGSSKCYISEDLVTGSSKVTSGGFLADKSTVTRPPGIDLEGDPTVLQEPYINSSPLGFA